MRFTELSELAVPYNDTLNPVLWKDDHLRTEVRYKLLLIAKHFAQFLNVTQLHLKDITISGSNASFGYSEYSDIDLHLIVDITDPNMAELFNAKKNNYNFKYDLKIKDIAVEVYVQDSKQPHYSAGIYSIIHENWINDPKHRPPSVSEEEVESKANTYQSQIDQALQSSNLTLATDTLDDIARLRKASLEKGGEFSVENLAFKLLRSNGKIDNLRKHIDKLQSADLSLGEQNED
jgi:hypothetical protein